MRDLRSFTNTNSTTPLSSFSRPARQDCAVRIVKSSSEGEGSSGKIATTTWLEVCSSKALSLAFRRSASAAGTRPA